MMLLLGRNGGRGRGRFEGGGEGEVGWKDGKGELVGVMGGGDRKGGREGAVLGDGHGGLGAAERGVWVYGIESVGSTGFRHASHKPCIYVLVINPRCPRTVS